MRSVGMVMVGMLLALGAGAGLAADHGSKPKQAMFKTKAEAEAAAPGFGCEGAHQMGEMWMVCAEHGQVHTPSH
ncbi:MAG: hypothetical protein VXZ59_08015 [Cyanobacteriota bacterium]|nr:hypothetical protein [Cyanobacteriota bacterium]